MPDSSVVAASAAPEGTLLAALGEDVKTRLERETLPGFLPSQRWFGGKDQAIGRVVLVPLAEIEPGAHAVAVADVLLSDEEQRYFLPLSAFWGEQPADPPDGAPVLARLAHGGRHGVLVDGARHGAFAAALLDAMREERRVALPSGELVARADEDLKTLTEPGSPKPLGAEQSNVSIRFGNALILKLYRRLHPGEQPDVEVPRFLTEEGGFANTPRILGDIRHLAADGQPTTLAAAFSFVENDGDAWAVVTRALREDVERAREAGRSRDPAAFGSPPSLRIGELLGRRTAEMHRALAVPTANPAFAVEPVSAADVAAWSAEAVAEAEAMLRRLKTMSPGLPAGSRALAEEILAKRGALLDRLGKAAGMAPSGGRSRIHGDYHLGQVLVSKGDFVIIDFEGEPRRGLKERREKSSPLRDVAGMLRSFDYAAASVLKTGGEGRRDDSQRVEAWRRQASAEFFQGYRRHVGGVVSHPADEGFETALIELFVLQKAVYEVGYELANRPDWADIPLGGVRALLAEGLSGSV